MEILVFIFLIVVVSLLLAGGIEFSLEYGKTPTKNVDECLEEKQIYVCNNSKCRWQGKSAEMKFTNNDHSGGKQAACPRCNNDMFVIRKNSESMDVSCTYNKCNWTGKLKECKTTSIEEKGFIENYCPKCGSDIHYFFKKEI
ncbi:MAG: hypothetical protein Q8K92_08425 [Leadbetterella sp.]|nr:hypothetical protein [Leadbetterella sp.]